MTDPSFHGRNADLSPYGAHFDKHDLCSFPNMKHFLLWGYTFSVQYVFPGSSLFSKPDLRKYQMTYKTWQALTVMKSAETSSFPESPR